MFCEAYNQPLKNTAANGEVPSPLLQQHLASCESCRDAFAEEQHLFAAIDSSLRAESNSEVPATLVPRVRVALNNEPVSDFRRLRMPVWGFAGATVAAAVIFGLLHSPSKHPSKPIEPAGPTSISVAKAPPSFSPVNPRRTSGVSSVQHKSPVVLVTNRISKPESLEALVLPDEGAALLHYEEFLRRKQAGAVLMASAKSLDLPPGIEPLQIAEIEMIDLKIPAMTKWDSEDDTK